MAAEVRVNGIAESLAARTLGELLAARGIDVRAPGVAVALNGEVIPRGRWSGHPVRSGDEIEIVGAVAGG